MHRAPTVISVGSIVWSLIAFIAGFAFPEHRLQIIGFMLGFFGMPLTLITPLPMIFVSDTWAPGYYVTLLLIAAGFLIQWQLVAWLLSRFLHRKTG